MEAEINKLIKEIEDECKPWENICRLSEKEKRLNIKYNWGTCIGDVVLRSAWQIHILKELRKRIIGSHNLKKPSRSEE